MPPLGVAAITLLFIAVGALYVVAEFAAVRSRRTRLSELAAEGNRRAKQLLPLLANSEALDRYIAACQVGITLSSLGVGFYGQAQLAALLTPWLASLGLPSLGPVTTETLAVIIVLILLTGLQMVLGELVPKSIALRYPERLALTTSLPMRWSLTVLHPFITLLNGSALGLMRAFKLLKPSEPAPSAQELELIVRESARGGLIDAEAREMLENVLRTGKRLARQIMIPRTRLVAAELHEAPRALLERLIGTPHTRFPVYEGSIDHIRGVLHLRELFWLDERAPEGALQEIVRPVPLLPETMTALELWEALRERGSYLALLVDEYGGVSGLVTLEDLIEEVVGELQDEFDAEAPLYRRGPGGRVFLRGDMLVSKVNARFSLNLSPAADTIGGFVLERLERIPAVGDEVDLDLGVLRVEEVRERAVTRVSLHLPDDWPAEESHS